MKYIEQKNCLNTGNFYIVQSFTNVILNRLFLIFFPSS